VMAGFTKLTDSNTYAPCYGVNHSDGGVVGTCDGCGASVAKRDDGKIFDVKEMGTFYARKIICWSGTHHCDPEIVTLYTARREALIASGEIVKGCTIRVVKGRKVPIGTEGRVFWMGEDSYGKSKIGIDAGGERIFIAASNCAPLSS
jgi:hypothetical protein